MGRSKDIATSAKGDADYVNVSGDTMTGNLGVNVSPTAALDVRRSDADGKIAEFHQNGGYGFELSSSQTVARFRSGYLQAMSITTDAGSGAAERMRISKEGYITKPSQPAFNAYRNTVLSTLTTWGAVPDYTGTRFNHGSHFNTSNGRFTAPVDGEYLFGVNNNMGSQQNVKSWRLYVNGSAWIILSYADVTASWQNLSASTLVTLNANDYIQFYYRGYPDYGNDWLNVYGYLMG